MSPPSPVLFHPIKPQDGESPAWRGAPASSSRQPFRGITKLSVCPGRFPSPLSQVFFFPPHVSAPPVDTGTKILSHLPSLWLMTWLEGKYFLLNTPVTPFNSPCRKLSFSDGSYLKERAGYQLWEPLEAIPWVIFKNMFLGARQPDFTGMAGLQMERGKKWLPWANSTDKWWANFSSVRVFCICWSESAKKFKFICLELYLSLCLSGSI